MPEWLPDMVSVTPWTHDTYDKLYSVFRRDIIEKDLLFQGFPVWIFREMEDGREVIFWHLTTRTVKAQKIPRHKRKFFPAGQTHTDKERYPDPRRCERLPWIQALIANSSAPEVLAWDYKEGDMSIKTYVWIKDWDFVVIMKKYPDGKRRLITSFYVDEPYKREDFKRKFNARLE